MCRLGWSFQEHLRVGTWWTFLCFFSPPDLNPNLTRARWHCCRLGGVQHQWCDYPFLEQFGFWNDHNWQMLLLCRVHPGERSPLLLEKICILFAQRKRNQTKHQSAPCQSGQQWEKPCSSQLAALQGGWEQGCVGGTSSLFSEQAWHAGLGLGYLEQPYLLLQSLPVLLYQLVPECDSTWHLPQGCCHLSGEGATQKSSGNDWFL